MQDKDLRPLRERREWLDVQDELKGTVKAPTKASLRAEAKQPFRLTRTFIFGGLGAAATLALLITATRVAAIMAQGGDSPELQARIHAKYTTLCKLFKYPPKTFPCLPIL